MGSRIARQAKVHLVDSGVASWLLNVTPAKIAQGDPVALTEYGHLLETFAVGEILKQVSWWDAPVAVGHFRTAVADDGLWITTPGQVVDWLGRGSAGQAR